MGKASQRAADLLPATRKRLLADLKRLEEDPIPLAAARPCSDSDLTLWDGVIGVEMEVTHMGRITVPLHFLIDFPADYPQTAPNIGFSFEFQYRGGAQYVMPDGRLQGKKVICLDVLGNFGHIHTEWKQEVGSGWSPAYTVTTLLVQLQSVLCDLGLQMSQKERDVTYQSAMRFCERNASSVLEIRDEDDIRDMHQQRRLASGLAKACSGTPGLVERAEAFASKAGFVHDEACMELFLALLGDVRTAGVASAGAGSPAGAPAGDPAATAAAPVDANICCFATGKLYTEALLGVGVARERRNLGTAGELLSKEAFDGGLRQSTNKSPFEFFLPVWINWEHAANNTKWRDAVHSSCEKIGREVFQASGSDCVLEVFPRLINQMIVEMMRPDAAKSDAIATFEALCNFWRTLRWLIDTSAPLQGQVRKLLAAFVSSEASRHKDRTPDIGMVLVLYTAFQGHEGCPSRQQFIDAYVDENSLRWVMWWQRAGTPAKSEPVFKQTQVSREIFMFQMTVVDVVIGDVGKMLQEVEATNCKLPERLDRLQAQWRARKASTTTWAKYFEQVGASLPAFASTDQWIAFSAQRAALRGPKYGGSGDDAGKGKGKDGGRGKGKGKGKAGVR